VARQPRSSYEFRIFSESSGATQYMWWMPRLRLFVLAVTLAMTTPGFTKVEQRAPASLRTRFGLSPSCDPSVTALTTDPAANRVTVAIDCRANPATTPPAGVSGERLRTK